MSLPDALSVNSWSTWTFELTLWILVETADPDTDALTLQNVLP